MFLVVVGALSSLSIGEKNRMKEPILSAASAEGAVVTPLLLFVMVSCLSASALNPHFAHSERTLSPLDVTTAFASRAYIVGSLA